MQTENNDESLRNELEAAFTETAAPANTTPESAPASAPTEGGYNEPSEPVGETAEQKAQREYIRDQQGKFAPKDSQNQAGLEAKPAQNEQKPTQDGIKSAPKANQPPVQGQEQPKAKDPIENAPQSWSPAEREAYKDMPLVAKQAAHRLEAVTQQTLREASEAKKFASEIQRTIAPYEHFIKAEGASVPAAIDSLFATAARLRTSTAPELAQLVSGLIQQFGVGRFGNGFIAQLDSALAGQPTNQMSPELQAIQQQMERELAPVRQMRQQMEVQQHLAAQQSNQVAIEHVAQFAETAEFLNDVRLQMADIMDMGERNGVKYTLQQAYDIACRAHPEISHVLEQREKAKLASSLNQTAQRAKSAAVSIGGAPALGGSNESGADSIRESIMLAMSQNGR